MERTTEYKEIFCDADIIVAEMPKNERTLKSECGSNSYYGNLNDAVRYCKREGMTLVWNGRLEVRGSKSYNPTWYMEHVLPWLTEERSDTAANDRQYQEHNSVMGEWVC